MKSEPFPGDFTPPFDFDALSNLFASNVVILLVRQIRAALIAL